MIRLEYQLKGHHEPTVQNIEFFFKEIEGDNKAAGAIATYIRKMWSSKTFDFNDFYLDRMAMSLTHLGPYESWNDFVKQEGRGPDWEFAEKMIERSFENLPDKVKLTINAMAERRASSIFLTSVSGDVEWLDSRFEKLNTHGYNYHYWAKLKPGFFQRVMHAKDRVLQFIRTVISKKSSS